MTFAGVLDDLESRINLNQEARSILRFMIVTSQRCASPASRTRHLKLRYATSKGSRRIPSSKKPEWHAGIPSAADGSDAAFIMVSLVSLPTSVVLGLLFELVGSSRIAAVTYLMLAPVLNWALICTGLGLVITKYRQENGGSGDGSLR